MSSPEAIDPLCTPDHEASPKPAGPDVTVEGASRALADNVITATYVPGPATGPADTEREHAHGSICVPGYEIDALLGRGGMGVVYKALHLTLKRTVALKMVLAGGHASANELARFRIEAEAVARLQHPNIVQIHEVGQADGHPYCALEFVEGGNLAKKITGKPLPPRVAAQLVEALARAMQLAHSRNVVHRDLKPANILLCPLPDGESSDRTAKVWEARASSPAVLTGRRRCGRRAPARPNWS
jgi:serine/threonine protein kinase